MAERLPISVFIIALNEADRIPLTIRSVCDWVDEVIVIDSGSTDDTVQVAEQLGARVVHNDWRGYGPQKVFGESLCKHDWVLNLDADEEVTDTLAGQIRSAVTGPLAYTAYRLAILPVHAFQDRGHPWTVNNRPVRLYRKSKAGFKDSTVHDSVVVHEGPVGRLSGMVNHRSFRSLEHHVEKVNSYSSAQADDLFRKGRNPMRLELALVPVLAFVKQYLLRREFVNGIDGVMVSYMYAFQRFIRLAKARERFQVARRNPGKTVLWWGRFDPDYSRNRILRQRFEELGWRVVDFRPRFGALGDVEAMARRLKAPDLVWVPCFRQRDMGAATRWARSRGVPLVFDPLISAYDKQVSERAKFSASSLRGKRLLAREGRQFRAGDVLVADTAAHADYFASTFGVPSERLAVIPVGAEEPLFHSVPLQPKGAEPLEVLFYGSFIGLHGPEWIVEAARIYEGPPVIWTLLGAGPQVAECKRRAATVPTVRFEPWDPYTHRPVRVHQADILLGVFGTGPKAGRVIPNKVYQSLACGRPVITRHSAAYPEPLLDGTGGMAFVPPGDPKALARAVAEWAAQPDRLAEMGVAARATYDRYFSNRAVGDALAEVLARVSA
ncbi:MAG: glycosyltransferase [Nitrospirota bacterium]|nr:glycosyltransferase [Nitrospirota bacterium]